MKIQLLAELHRYVCLSQVCVYISFYILLELQGSVFFQTVLEIIQSLSIKYFCAIACSKPPVSYLVAIMCLFICFPTDSCIFSCEQHIGF